MTDGSGKGIFPPSTARHGPPSAKRRAACKRMSSYRKPDVVWTEDLDAQLMDLIADGQSFTQAGGALGLSASQASSRFKRLRDGMGWQAS